MSRGFEYHEQPNSNFCGKYESESFNLKKQCDHQYVYDGLLQEYECVKCNERIPIINFKQATIEKTCCLNNGVCTKCCPHVYTCITRECDVVCTQCALVIDTTTTTQIPFQIRQHQDVPEELKNILSFSNLPLKIADYKCLLDICHFFNTSCQLALDALKTVVSHEKDIMKNVICYRIKNVCIFFLYYHFSIEKLPFAIQDVARAAGVKSSLLFRIQSRLSLPATKLNPHDQLNINCTLLNTHIKKNNQKLNMKAQRRIKNAMSFILSVMQQKNFQSETINACLIILYCNLNNISLSKAVICNICNVSLSAANNMKSKIGPVNYTLLKKLLSSDIQINTEIEQEHFVNNAFK